MGFTPLLVNSGKASTCRTEKRQRHCRVSAGVGLGGGGDDCNDTKESLSSAVFYVPLNHGRKYKAFAIIPHTLHYPGNFSGTYSLGTNSKFTIRRFTFPLPGHLVDGHGAGTLGALPVSVQITHRGGKKAALWQYKITLKF
jgi:hypothetical protein